MLSLCAYFAFFILNTKDFIYMSFNLYSTFFKCLFETLHNVNVLCYWIFQLLGLCIFIVGIWAWTEKDIFNNLSRLTNITLDPAFVFIVAGVITFTIGFTGCVGALRENTCLLASVCWSNSFFLILLGPW